MYFFFLELIIAEGMFAGYLRRRKKFILRLLLSIACAFAIQFVYDWFLEPLYGRWTILDISHYLLLIITTTFVIYVSFDCSLIRAIACATGGYAVRNFIYCIGYLLYSWVGMGFDVTQIETLNRFLESLFFLAGYIPFFFWIRYNIKRHGMDQKTGINLMSVVISVLIVFSTIIISAYIPFETGATDYAFIYSAICSILVVGMQLGIFEKSALQRELETIKRLDRMKWEQYKLFRESMEQINIKSHDLKQQINLLLSSSPDMRNNLLEDTLKTVNVYDSMIRTGNETLDVVLTEKLLICGRNDIKCSCIADGSVLDFMRPMDIASLIGNAMDNAIESVRKCEEEDRFINVNISMQGEFLLIHIENRFNEALTFQNGLPQTTKSNKSEHGFGMKSIRMIVEKYNGNMLIQNAGGGLFVLDIMFVKPL